MNPAAYPWLDAIHLRRLSAISARLDELARGPSTEVDPDEALALSDELERLTTRPITEEQRACGEAIEDELARLREQRARKGCEAPPDEAPPPTDDDAPPEMLGGPRKTRGPSQATRVVDLALETGAELWHSPDGRTLITVAVDGHPETWRLRSPGSREWLARLFYGDSRAAPSSEAIASALGVLGGMARVDGPEHAVHVRVAGDDAAIYLDLADPERRVIEVTAEGWRFAPDAPIRFLRPRGMLALPEPIRGGSVDELRPLVNVAAEQWPLVAAWLVAALRPRGPYPVLALVGQHDAGKSSITTALRSVVDPNQAMRRRPPKEERDLLIAAGNSWVLTLENVSHVPSWLSDALCAIATGGGYAARELYSDDDEVIVDVQRAVILNGIGTPVTAGDLLDRSLLIAVPKLEDRARRPEAELAAELSRVRPRVLGALLDAVVTALRQWREVRLVSLPRLADFAMWVSAAEAELGFEPGAFMAAYGGNREDATAIALEASPIVEPLRKLLDRSGGKWEGSAAELLSELDALVPERERGRDGWPRRASALGQALQRVAPALRAAGVHAASLRSGRSRAWQIAREVVTDGAGPSVTGAYPSVTKEPQSARGDASRGDGRDGPCPYFPHVPSTPYLPFSAAGVEGGEGNDGIQEVGKKSVTSVTPVTGDDDPEVIL